jgi:hypothetical protein
MARVRRERCPAHRRGADLNMRTRPWAPAAVARHLWPGVLAIVGTLRLQSDTDHLSAKFERSEIPLIRTGTGR